MAGLILPDAFKGGRYYAVQGLTPGGEASALEARVTGFWRFMSPPIAVLPPSHPTAKPCL